jgi:hypothetical protein
VHAGKCCLLVGEVDQAEPGDHRIERVVADPAEILTVGL